MGNYSVEDVQLPPHGRIAQTNPGPRDSSSAVQGTYDRVSAYAGAGTRTHAARSPVPARRIPHNTSAERAMVNGIKHALWWYRKECTEYGLC